MHSFDTPDFHLMAHLLRFLATLHDPGIVTVTDLSHAPGRVDFVRGVAE
jgi:hypothetical protein